jgi:hypothetical protein
MQLFLTSGDDTAGTLLSVAEAGRDGQFAHLTDAHALETLVPSLDHLTCSKLETEWLVAIMAETSKLTNSKDCTVKHICVKMSSNYCI